MRVPPDAQDPQPGPEVGDGDHPDDVAPLEGASPAERAEEHPADGATARSGAGVSSQPTPEPQPIFEPTPERDEVVRRRRDVIVDLDLATVLYVVGAVLAVWALLGLSRSAVDSLTKIVVGLVLALAFDQVVSRLQARRWSRGAAAAVVCGSFLAVLVALATFVGPPAARQAAQFGRQLPETVEDFYKLPVVGPRLERADAAEEVQRRLAELPTSITADTVTGLVDRVVGGLTGVVEVMLVTFAVLLDGQLIVARARRAVPERHRERADWVGRLFYLTLGRYFAGSLLLAVMNGTYILVVGLALGVPLAPVAAIWVSLTNLIPQIGGLLGGSLFVTLAITQGPVTGLLALALFLLYMNTENYVLQPAVVGNAVNLSPVATMIGAIVGGAAAGVPGALVTTPLVGTVKALYLALRYDEDPLQEHRSVRVPGLGKLRDLMGHIRHRGAG